MRFTNTENLPSYSPLSSLPAEVNGTRENHLKMRESSCISEDSANSIGLLFKKNQNLFAQAYVWSNYFQIIMESSPKIFLLQYFYVRVLKNSLPSLAKDIIKSMGRWAFLDFEFKVLYIAGLVEVLVLFTFISR